jgi:hypothetical protein
MSGYLLIIGRSNSLPSPSEYYQLMFYMKIVNILLDNALHIFGLCAANHAACTSQLGYSQRSMTFQQDDRKP